MVNEPHVFTLFGEGVVESSSCHAFLGDVIPARLVLAELLAHRLANIRSMCPLTVELRGIANVWAGFWTFEFIPYYDRTYHH